MEGVWGAPTAAGPSETLPGAAGTWRGAHGSPGPFLAPRNQALLPAGPPAPTRSFCRCPEAAPHVLAAPRPAPRAVCCRECCLRAPGRPENAQGSRIVGLLCARGLPAPHLVFICTASKARTLRGECGRYRIAAAIHAIEHRQQALHKLQERQPLPPPSSKLAGSLAFCSRCAHWHKCYLFQGALAARLQAGSRQRLCGLGPALPLLAAPTLLPPSGQFTHMHERSRNRYARTPCLPPPAAAASRRRCPALVCLPPCMQTVEQAQTPWLTLGRTGRTRMR